MLIEATTGEDPDRRGLADGEQPIGLQHSRSQTQGITPITHHPSQHLLNDPHASSRVRHRSPSLERDRAHHGNPPHLHQSHHSARSRASSSLSLAHQSLHPSAQIAGPGLPSGPGVPGGPISLAQSSQTQAYQTHIFAPPVTGAPVKKSKLTNTPSSASVGAQGSNGTVLTMGMSTPPQPYCVAKVLLQVLLVMLSRALRTPLVEDIPLPTHLGNASVDSADNLADTRRENA